MGVPGGPGRVEQGGALSRRWCAPSLNPPCTVIPHANFLGFLPFLHRLTYVNDLPTMLKNLCANAGSDITVTTQSSVVGRFSGMRWEGGGREKAAPRKKIAAKFPF